MRDIHNHIIYGIDDGAKTIEDSILIIKEMVRVGYKDIIFTPHYISGSTYTSDNKDKQERLSKIRSILDSEKVEVNLYMGNEVFIDFGLIDRMREGKIRTLNNSRYLLIEFSLNNKLSIDKEILFELRNAGCIPILAHPERYTEYFNDFDFFKDLIDMGVLLQGNLKTLMGKYGSVAKGMLEELLRKDMIHFMASDVHRVEDMSYIEKMVEDLESIVGKERAKELIDTNILNVIEDKDITAYEIKEEKKHHMFDKMKFNFKLGGTST